MVQNLDQTCDLVTLSLAQNWITLPCYILNFKLAEQSRRVFQLIASRTKRSCGPDVVRGPYIRQLCSKPNVTQGNFQFYGKLSADTEIMIKEYRTTIQKIHYLARIWWEQGELDLEKVRYPRNWRQTAHNRANWRNILTQVASRGMFYQQISVIDFPRIFSEN